MRNIYFSSTGQTALCAPNVGGLDAAICMDAGNMLQALPPAKLGYSGDGPAPHLSPVDGLVLGDLFGCP